MQKLVELERDMQTTRARVNERLDALLHGGPATLIEAMRYAVLGPGKRLRPIFCVWTYELLQPEAAEPPIDAACALELVHAYSLVHDDLPCMDDDALRRGRPTCHVRFGEAIALLAGDALLNLGYETLLHAKWASPERALEAARTLADAASHRELVGGQVLDLEGEGRTPTAAAVDAIHLAKTAALLRASLLLGAHAAGASADDLRKLGEVGRHLGLAFQITDDVLDVQGNDGDLGKTAGKDAAAAKLTYPAVYGVEVSRQHAERHIEEATRLLATWAASERLQALAAYCARRLH